MKNRRILSTLLLVMSFLAIVSTTALADGTMTGTLANDGRFSEFLSLVDRAGLSGSLNSWDPVTVIAPRNEAFNQLSGDVRAQLQSAENARKVVLSHVIRDEIDVSEIQSVKSLRNANGETLSVVHTDGKIIVSGGTLISVHDVNNGMAYGSERVILSANLSAAPAAASGGATTGGSPAAPAQPAQPAGPDLSKPEGFWADRFNDIGSPGDNPAYRGDQQITRQRGMSNEFAGCRGMTWVLHNQTGGYAAVGADSQTNPYRGDTPCNETFPILCIRTDETIVAPANLANNWGGGQLAASLPVQGSALTSVNAANAICRAQLDYRYKMATFHENGNSWRYWAKGPVPNNMRFWVNIEDQLGNPWNSANYIENPPRAVYNAPTVSKPTDNWAFKGYGFMPWAEGTAGGRTSCKGMTWVVLHQVNNLTNVGADRFTNPFLGDTSCWATLPALCIRPNNYPVPALEGFNVAPKWSGAEVRLTSNAISGRQMDTRGKANQICTNNFGPGWRLAQFHDGGIIGSEPGWSLWAYGGLPINTRFWVSNGSQRANTYDFWQP